MASSDFLSLLTKAGTTVAGAAVGPIEVRTNLNADSPIIIDPFAPPAEEQPKSKSIWMSLLKPEIRVALPNGEYKYAPAGKPSANFTPLIIAAVGGLLFTLVGVGGLIGRFASPKILLGTGVCGLAALAFIASQTKLEEADAAVS